MKFSAYDPWSKPSKSGGDKDKDNNRDNSDSAGRSSRRNNRRGRSDSIISELFRLINSLVDSIMGTRSNKSPQNGGKKPRRLYSLGGILAILIAIWAALGIYMIDEQERGVVLRFGKYYSVLTPGLKWQPYLIDRVIVLNVTQVRSFSSRGIMLTQDENIVDITVNVQYIIDSPKDFVINIKDPELSLRQATDSSLRHVVGSTIMDQVITEGRAAVASAVQERIQRYVDSYGTGILVSQVSIQRADPPEQVKASFEDVISAREDKVRFINQATAYSNGIIPQARGEARRILEDGEAYKRDKIARAQGQTERFDLVYTEYAKAPEITRQRLYLEAMEEVLTNSNKIIIDISEGNNNLLYLPLDKLLNQSGSSPLQQSPAFTPDAPASGPSGQSTNQGNQRVNDIVNRVLEEIRRGSSRAR